jgi:hypothetical protein
MFEVGFGLVLGKVSCHDNMRHDQLSFALSFVSLILAKWNK